MSSSTQTNEPFHNPKDFGTFDLATSQIDKPFVFRWDTEVIPQAKIVAVSAAGVVREYTVGNGLTLTDSDRTVTWEVSGADFVRHRGHEVQVQCNFFVRGDVEVTFTLRIIDSAL